MVFAIFDDLNLIVETNIILARKVVDSPGSGFEVIESIPCELPDTLGPRLNRACHPIRSLVRCSNKDGFASSRKLVTILQEDRGTVVVSVRDSRESRRRNV